ncbi:hypothetical protein CDAR_555261 [Caerostris darwini]|uniref:Uncharacterized protein n=1 Tax=Caerostris darwini TaxID=1538125 RepID=A0AAV4RK87_9ARAC|nr:hypothetical protein CDAR_555261 [Caerostris darwini]
MSTKILFSEPLRLTTGCGQSNAPLVFPLHPHGGGRSERRGRTNNEKGGWMSRSSRDTSRHALTQRACASVLAKSFHASADEFFAHSGVLDERKSSAAGINRYNFSAMPPS